MEIGPLLKKYRLNMGLTLERMAAGVLSISYYSKIEKGQHRISAEDLFALLHAHSISLEDFLSQLDTKENVMKEYNHRLIAAYYQNDTSSILKIIDEWKDSTEESAIQLVALAESCLHALNDQFAISQQSIHIIKEKLFLLPNWNLFKLSLYTNFIDVYSIETNQMIIGSILSKKMATFNEEEKKTIIAILLNYVGQLMMAEENLLVAYYLDKTRTLLIPRPDLMYYKALFTYYEHLNHYILDRNKLASLEKCRTIADFMRWLDFHHDGNQMHAYLDKITSK